MTSEIGQLSHFEISEMSHEITKRVTEWREKDREIRFRMNAFVGEVERLVELGKLKRQELNACRPDTD